MLNKKERGSRPAHNLYEIPPSALSRVSGSAIISRLYWDTIHKRLLRIADVLMFCRSYSGSIRRDQVQGQPRLSHKPARACLEDSRFEIKQTLRLHKVGTAVLLFTILCISLIAAGGLTVAVLEKLSPRAIATSGPLSDFRMVAICLGGWFFCFHYLWRCYRSGLEDVRGLLRQLSQLEQIRDTFAAERRALRKQRLLASNTTGSDVTAASETSRAQARKPKQGRTRVQTPQVDVTGVENVVKLDSYRRL